MRHVPGLLAFTLALSLLAAPAAAQKAATGPKSAEDDKALAAPKDVVATQTGDTVTIRWQDADSKAASFRLYGVRNGVTRLLATVASAMERQVVLNLEALATALGVRRIDLFAGPISFSVEALNPKGAVSPKANASILLKDATTAPADPGPSGDKAPAGPKDVTATQTGDAVTIRWQDADSKAASFRLYGVRNGVTRLLATVASAMERQVVLNLEALATALGVRRIDLFAGPISFSVEALNPKGAVSPKANASILLKDATTAPADPGPTTTTPTTTTPTTGGPKDSTLPDKAWAAQTSRSEVTLAWNAAKDATAHRVFFVINGRRFALGTFVPRVSRAVFTMQRLSALAGQTIAALLATPLAFEIETLVDTRVAGLLRFNQVMPVSPEKGLAAKQAPRTVQAAQTGAREITLTWEPVPDATAYSIGRAVDKGGFKMLCGLCPTDTRFVDTEVTPGVKHVYTVQAVTADGMGLRATSNPVPDDGSKSSPRK